MNGDLSGERGKWPEGTADAQAFVARAVEAAQTEVEPPAFAKTRVWSAIEARRRARFWPRRLLPVSAGLAAFVMVAMAFANSRLRTTTATASGGTQAAAPKSSAATEATTFRSSGERCAGLHGPRGIACLDEESASSDALRAESALFEKGWRQLREAGDARGALVTWTAARARFPRGVLRLETDLSIVQASVKVDDRSRARGEINAFFAAHPRALQAPEIHFLRGTLERADGHCDLALHEFDLALRAPSEPWAGEARTQRAACRHRRR